MINFFGWIVHYLIVLIFLAIVAGVGAKIGISLRKNKNAKEEASAESGEK